MQLHKSDAIVVLLLFAVGLLLPFPSASMAPSSSTISSDRTCSANDANDMEYLAFCPPLPGAGLQSSPRVCPEHQRFSHETRKHAGGKTRQVGFGASINTSSRDKLRRLLDAVEANDHRRCRTNPYLPDEPAHAFGTGCASAKHSPSVSRRGRCDLDVRVVRIRATRNHHRRKPLMGFLPSL